MATARYAVMSGASAANTLAEVRAKQMERGGKVLSETEKAALHEEIRVTTMHKLIHAMVRRAFD